MSKMRNPKELISNPEGFETVDKLKVGFESNIRNLTNAKANSRQCHRASFVAILLMAITLGTFPYVNQPGPFIPPFLTAFIVAIAFAQLMTTYLLFSQYWLNRTPALLVLVATFLYAGLITIPYILTFPGVFSGTGLLEPTSQTTSWLWTFWDAGFPLGILAYLLVDKFYKHVQFNTNRAIS